MKFFIPYLDEQDSIRTLKDIRSMFEDATGWQIADQTLFRLEFKEQSERRTAAVGQELYGRLVRAIFVSDQAMIVCTNCHKAECKPVFVPMTAVVETEAFDVDEAVGPAGPCDCASTFLLTDIVGSTKLWEEHPDQMRTALSMHDSILELGVLRNGGQVFNSAGDAFFCKFDSVPQAARAATQAQIALKGAEWPRETPITVRMAIHCGDASQWTGGGYVGASANHAANLLKLGHGEQILVSKDAVDACRGILPYGAMFKPLGSYRLGEISEATEVFQIVHASLKLHHPPLRVAA